MKVKKYLYGVLVASVFFLGGCSEEHASAQKQAKENQKEDAALIQESFEAAMRGNQKSILVVNDFEVAYKEIREAVLEDRYGFIAQKKLNMLEDCKIEAEVISGNWAKVRRSCANSEQGVGYMKKENGSWKVPVRE